MKQCLACLGTYEPVSKDGSLYFHACPPLARARVRRAAVWQMVAIADVQPTDEVEIDRAGVKLTVLVAAVQKDDVRIGDDTAPRPNARDENVENGKRQIFGPAATADQLMKAVGAGVKDV